MHSTSIIKGRLFLVLFCLGLTGILSLLLLDLSALISLLPKTTTDIPTITPALKLLSLVQPAVFLALAVLIGIVLAPKVGLSSPAAEALVSGGNVLKALKPQFGPGLAGGLAGGFSIVLISFLTKPFLAAAATERISEFQKVFPIPTRILYGGLTEELLLRWGFMTLVVWVVWRVLQKQRAAPTKIAFVSAILVSSLVFGVGHLPVAFMLLPDYFGPALVLFVVIANSTFGVIAGFLYWKRGLESAMIAHIVTHVLMALASSMGAYF